MSEVASKARGLVVFDLDGTLVDDMHLIGQSAARVIHEAFGTPLEVAAAQYYSTTGKPFELQLRELYPEATPFELSRTVSKFHETKVKDAYRQASLFREVPEVLRRLDRSGWSLVVATGAEKEMAELILEREGIAFLIQKVLGAGQGTKDVHLREYSALLPGLPHVMVGDSRFDMEVARRFPDYLILGRASHLADWTLTPNDLKRWGARWADYTLERLPEVLDELAPPAFG